MSQGTPGVIAESLTKVFTRKAVDSVSFTVARGEIFGLLGANGAGKTTTLRMLCGLLEPTSGRALIAGIDMTRDPRSAKARLGYLDEEPFVYPNLTGREFLDFVADLYFVPRGRVRDERIDRLLKLFELTEKQDDMITNYSHGMKQKTGLASLLVHEPEVLLLDEPTNGMDPRSARTVKDLMTELASRGTSIILSTHILEVAQALCHRIGIMNQSRLVAVGTMEELRAAAGGGDRTLEELFLSLTGGAESRSLIAELLS